MAEVYQVERLKCRWDNEVLLGQRRRKGESFGRRESECGLVGLLDNEVLRVAKGKRGNGSGITSQCGGE